jgi:TM2 domain-containing membrane protein YozV
MALSVFGDTRVDALLHDAKPTAVKASSYAMRNGVVKGATMPVFKCKMCGGDLKVEQGSNIGVCAYCGSMMTLPKLDDERRVELFNRGNHFRRSGDYDKAAGVFDIILAEDPTDAEAHWSLALCHYGIAYVEDPRTSRRIPTINRLQTASILACTDYQQALVHSTGSAHSLYQQEAQVISQIQRAALAVVSSGDAFDAFICYKETDASGQRTRDSVIAQELYQELVRNGFRPFFSRITLETKVGTEYEPHIFAALQTAKVMIVVGTSRGNFEAVWVRNEWSRYLALMKEHSDKRLIPVYRDMDPYDLPDELSTLQALDASRLGFMQDLIHGLKKIIASGSATVSTPQLGQAYANQRYAGQQPSSAVAVTLPDGLTFEQGQIWLALNAANPAQAVAYTAQCLQHRSQAIQQQAAFSPPIITQQPVIAPVGQVAQKSKVVAGLLALFLGHLGIHKFYLGYTGAGVTLLVTTLISGVLTFAVIGFLGLFVVGVICLVECFTYLTKSDKDFARIYVRGKKEWF